MRALAGACWPLGVYMQSVFIAALLVGYIIADLATFERSRERNRPRCRRTLH